MAKGMQAKINDPKTKANLDLPDTTNASFPEAIVASIAVNIPIILIYTIGLISRRKGTVPMTIQRKFVYPSTLSPEL